MFSLKFQEKIRKPIIGLAGLMHKTGLAGIWLRLISASQRFIMWQSPYWKSLNPTHVIDIGANSGEFALMARSAFPLAEIISFEPQNDAYGELVSLMKGDNNFQSHQVALGESDSSAEMYISPFSAASSLIINQTKEYHLETIELKKLDNYSDLINLSNKIIIKIDVEGYELHVLKGGEKFIQKADYIYIESRTTEPVGCKFSEIYEFLITRGWSYLGAYDACYSKQGKLQYFDALFKNERKNK